MATGNARTDVSTSPLGPPAVDVYVCPVCRAWTTNADDIDCDCNVGAWSVVVYERTNRDA